MFVPRRALAALSLLTLAGTVSPALANTTPATDGEDAAQRGFTNPNIKRMSKLPRNTDVTKVVTQSSLSLAQNREVTNSSTKVREGKAIGRTSTEIRETSTVTRSTKVSREMRSSPTTSPTVMRVAPAPAPQQNAAVPGKGTRKLASAARKATPKPAAKTAAASSQAKA